MCPASAALTPMCPAVAVLASPYARDLEYLRETLKQNDIRIIEAATHREALEAIGRYGPSVIVYDESLPWRDVLSYTAECYYPSRLIVIAASPVPPFVAEVVNLGGYDVLTKPFSAREVSWIVAFDEHRSQVKRRPLNSEGESATPTVWTATV